MNKKLLEKIINDVSLDERVNDGMFNIEEASHMEALREYLSKKGMDENSVRSFSNRVLEGKYPERQAYNAKGILVTFPTPEYKAEAIKRGTHFEKDPTKGQSNLFHQGAPGATPNAMPVAGESDKKEPTPTTSTPKTSLPVSQATNVPSSNGDVTPQTVQPQTTAAPQQTPVSTPAAEPVKEPTDLPQPPLKSPAEKEANKNAIKTMLKGDDYMLEEVAEFIQFNAPPYMLEKIRRLI